MGRLKETYQTTVAKKLGEQFGYKNHFEIPRLEKVVINMGVGREVTSNPKAIDAAVQDLLRITGQRPVIRRARKAIANFKLREGLPIGVSVTLRRQMMWEFCDRLINIALPRVRDFRGTSRTAFDGRGNYTLGLPEQIIFPEIDLEKSTIRGMNVTFVTTAKTDKEAEALLQHLGMPFRKKSEVQQGAGAAQGAHAAA
ncbi:MAG: 50S ribosomal protein L5 [Bdellovibrionota bacterium]